MKTNHPEALEDEGFLMNATIGVGIDDVDTYLNWKTKRAGIKAYGNFGERIEGKYPIFVKKAEALKKMYPLGSA